MELMKCGERIKAFPIHLVTMRHQEEGSDLKIGFSVPARIHRSAVMRIRLKRRMRESVRPFIPRVSEELNQTGASLMFIHVGPTESDQALIQMKINLLLERFLEQASSPITDE